MTSLTEKQVVRGILLQTFHRNRLQYASSDHLGAAPFTKYVYICVCVVLHVKPFLLPVDVQHTHSVGAD